MRSNLHTTSDGEMPRDSSLTQVCFVRYLVTSALLVIMVGCVPHKCQVEEPNLAFNNTTDPTNAAASYVGAAACLACHPERLDTTLLHDHEDVGVQCEACHGPGSTHMPNPAARDIFVDPTPETCGRCHTRGGDPQVIVVTDGFLAGNSQYSQLLASGGHSDFNCTVCHDPHASIKHDRDNGLRNGCTACHVDTNLALHDGAVFELGGEVEVVSCESCHMPLAGLNDSFAPPELVGPDARIGDVRAHIFRIDTENATADAMFTADGSAVRKRTDGRAAVTTDFVCLRCHNQAGGAFPLTPGGAQMMASGMHTRAAEAEVEAGAE